MGINLGRMWNVWSGVYTTAERNKGTSLGPRPGIYGVGWNVDSQAQKASFSLISFPPFRAARIINEAMLVGDVSIYLIWWWGKQLGNGFKILGLSQCRIPNTEH